MKYMKITKEIREKNEIPKSKLHVFLFFSSDQNLLRDITAKVTLIFRLNFAYNSYESLLKKKVLIYKAISGTDNAYCGSKLKFPFLLVLFTSWYDVSDTMRFWYGWKIHSLDSDLFDN